MNNTVFLIGRLTKDPELRANENVTDICIFTIAVNRTWKNADGEYLTDFITCKTFGYTAKNINEYCKKGDLIGVQARIQTGSYEKEGKTIYTQDIIAEKISFLSSSAKKEETKEETPVAVAKDPFEEFGEEVVINDDDLPF